MELTRRDFRSMILYDFKSSLNETQCVDRLSIAFGESAPSRATVFRWFREFKRGQFSLEDGERSGRPQTAVTEENIVAVETMIKEDPRSTYEDIECSLGISSPSVFKILHDHLRVRKITSRWVPHQLTDAQKETRVKWCKEMLEKYESGNSRRVADIVTGDESWIYQYEPETKRQSAVWIFPDDPLPTKVKRPRSVGKKMVATFFSRSGHICTVPLENQRTVTAQWYTTICLPQVFQKIEERRPRSGLRGIQLHHDNASSHSAHKTLDFIQQTPVKLVSHPPYSPDLAPCDFYLFPTVKNILRGKRFTTPEDAVAAYEEEVKTLSENEWRECFKKWFIRMERCVECQGEYFEKM